MRCLITDNCPYCVSRPRMSALPPVPFPVYAVRQIVAHSISMDTVLGYHHRLSSLVGSTQSTLLTWPINDLNTPHHSHSISHHHPSSLPPPLAPSSAPFSPNASGRRIIQHKAQCPPKWRTSLLEPDVSRPRPRNVVRVHVRSRGRGRTHYRMRHRANANADEDEGKGADYEGIHVNQDDPRPLHDEVESETRTMRYRVSQLQSKCGVRVSITRWRCMSCMFVM